MKQSHTEGPRSILIPLFAALLAGATAQADLLLYDGFATATDSQSRTP